ncbi:hypothetical protein D3C76_1348940 [compost metagenome]
MWRIVLIITTEHAIAFLDIRAVAPRTDPPSVINVLAIVIRNGLTEAPARALLRVITDLLPGRDW